VPVTPTVCCAPDHFSKVLALAHAQHVRLQAETDPLIRAFEEASDALKDGDA
jgi:hypothetical protein